MNDLRVGSTITIYSRQLKVASYGDTHTKKALESKQSRTLAIIKPDAYVHTGKIIDAICRNGFTISNLKMLKWSPEQAHAFYSQHPTKSPYSFDEVAKFMSSDVIVALEIAADNAVENWLSLIGPENSPTARTSAPNTMRALFGTDGLKNAVHGSESSAAADYEIEYVFGAAGGYTTALLNNCTCLMIKPDAIQGGQAGRIIDMVLEDGFEISAMEQFRLDQSTAEEFFEVYKGVLPEFGQMVEHVISAPVIVMEVRQENAVQTLRKLVGPHDPDTARHSHPGTIRGKYGTDKVRNAVHCTDLAEDGVLECEYFFSILQKK